MKTASVASPCLTSKLDPAGCSSSGQAREQVSRFRQDTTSRQSSHLLAATDKLPNVGADVNCTFLCCHQWFGPCASSHERLTEYTGAQFDSA